MDDKSGFDGTSDRVSESIQVSRVLRPNPDEQAFHHYLTLGIEDTLQAHHLIKDIKMIIRPPIVPGSLITWERKYKRKLPMDLKNYYYSTNGFRLTWNLEYGGELLRVGDMNINSLMQLLPLDGSGKGGGANPKIVSSTKRTNGHVPDYNSKRQTDEPQACHRISFSDLQKLKNDSMPTALSTPGTSQQASGGGSKNHPSALKSLVLPPDGQAFQLDSSKPTKGIVCLVYLHAAPQMTQRQLHGTPKKKLSQFRMIDFKGSMGSHHYNDPLYQSSDPGRQCVDTTASFNKSIEELEEERDVENTESCFNFGDNMENVQVWFLDPSYEWHFLAPTFSHYYKMLLYHLGLPEWEYRFTPYGLSSFAEQMFWVVAPHLLQQRVKNHGQSLNNSTDEDNVWSSDYPPEAGKPNPVNNVINMNLFRKKKRDKKQM